jgi:hypothetical protein
MARSSYITLEDENIPGKDSLVNNVKLGYLDQQLHFENVKLSFIGIYSYATGIDLCLVAISAVFAAIGGALIPVTPVR